MSILLMRVMHYENLQITDISTFNPSAFIRKAKMKSRVKVKKKERKKTQWVVKICRERVAQFEELGIENSNG